ncbi:MAG: hypothetical protein Q8S58_03655 [Bosea sp. (in: a-proteobacteria)]|uniref:hypothetical protein n=1 Tax=Bosea sp. (in: a-proteobacteria) TaxID=1871050 RepID=UPI0027336E59|nr:hypothetical protein [Bosea sp. (in: a-proteobacteria)]MDP3258763.1 hypothetical protein [Bosea sp. (in: a-proteobacteria)]MDP3318205.1 hypothetical protein [Bosea sp. (in: a-proteobacteria)]
MAVRRIVMLGLATAMSVSGAPSVQAANLFEELGRAIFGGGPRLRATPIYEYDEPRQAMPRQKAPEVSSKPKPPVVQLDPSSDPNWYLKDPTLRRGDIVVTAQGVMVYQGGRGDGRRSDFTALGAGKDSKGWKHQLEMAAAGGRSFFEGATAPPKPAITAQAEAKAP